MIGLRLLSKEVIFSFSSLKWCLWYLSTKKWYVDRLRIAVSDLSVNRLLKVAKLDFETAEAQASI